MNELQSPMPEKSFREKRVDTNRRVPQREARRGRTAREGRNPQEAEQTAEKVEEVKARIARTHFRAPENQQPGRDPQEYVARYLPKHLEKPSSIAKKFHAHSVKTLAQWEREGKVQIEGREHIPEGASVLVANHTRMKDEVRMGGLTNHPVHIVAADMHFTGGLGIKRAVLNRLGFIEAFPSLLNLTDEEKVALMQRVSSDAKGYYEKVLAREHNQDLVGKQKEFIRSAVAALVKGDTVAMFPEGLWLYEGDVMRKAYPGLEVIAAEYERVTGKPLPIVPVGITDTNIRIGEPMSMDRKQGKDVHAVMEEVAKLLPEEARGYYRDKV